VGDPTPSKPSVVFGSKISGGGIQGQRTERDALRERNALRERKLIEIAS
jgi:hypothetical protein